MPESFQPLRRIPQPVKVVVNQGRGVHGSFIDPEWVWHYIAAGQWEFQLESKSYAVGPGDLVLIPPRLLHVVRSVRGRRLVQWVVHFEMPEGPPHSRDFPFAVATSTVSRHAIADTFRALQEEWKARRPQYKTIAGGLLAALLGYHYRHGGEPKTATPRDGGHWRNVELAIHCIQEDYADAALNLPAISRAARLSPNYLCRVFKNCLGLTVMHYLAFYRVQKAEELLLCSSMNCSEIATEVGFDSVHRLSRIFHKLKGMPPTAYREKNS